MDTPDQAHRRAAVTQAIANLAARGIVIDPPVRSLYEGYIMGTTSRAQIRAAMTEYLVTYSHPLL